MFHTQPNLSSAVSRAEIKVAAFAVEHHLSYNIMNHVSELLPAIFPDSEIAKGNASKRTKCSAVIDNVLGANFKKELQEKIEGSKFFSLIVDESTDISTKSVMAVVVKYFDDAQNKESTSLLGLPLLKGTSAEGLFATMKEELGANNMNLQNCVGFAADTTNVMFGINNSIVSRLKEDNPHIITVKCTCHSISLAVSHATKLLPKPLEQLLRDCNSYFSHSSKRMKDLKEFQDFIQCQQQRILRLHDIRWLSMGACVARVLEQWNVLHLYFQLAHTEDRLQSSDFLYNEFCNPYTHLYFQFLDYILSITDQLNILFQSFKWLRTVASSTLRS